MASTRASFTPAFSARLPAAWMIGPSAIGSVNGMPISIRSAPAAGMPRSSAMRGRRRPGPRLPGTGSARRGLRCFSAAKRAAMRLMAGRRAERNSPPPLAGLGREADQGGGRGRAPRSRDLRTDPSPHPPPCKGRGRIQHLAITIRRHSFTPRCSATVKMSLSPRPHRFIRMIWSLPIVGASFVTCASACAGSSAGMMPSVRVQSWNAASASSSVADDVFDAADIVQPGMLRPDAGIVQPGADASAPR